MTCETQDPRRIDNLFRVDLSTFQPPPGQFSCLTYLMCSENAKIPSIFERLGFRLVREGRPYNLQGTLVSSPHVLFLNSAGVGVFVCLTRPIWHSGSIFAGKNRSSSFGRKISHYSSSSDRPCNQRHLRRSLFWSSTISSESPFRPQTLHRSIPPRAMVVARNRQLRLVHFGSPSLNEIGFTHRSSPWPARDQGHISFTRRE